MAEETAVIESPLEVVEEQEVETPETPAIETPEADADADGRSFAGKLREAFKKLNASGDPSDKEVAKEIKRLHFAEKALKDEFPGGIQEIRQLKETVTQLGAPEEIAAARESAAILEDIDNKWIAGDPTFIDELVKLNPESFRKLMPVALRRFASDDPEGYQRELSGIISNTLVSSRMDTQLMLIADAVESGNKEKALGLIKGIEEWMTKLDTVAKTPAKQQEQPDNKLAEKEQQLNDREAAMFNRDIATEFNAWRSSQIKSQLAKLRAGRPEINPERYEIFEDRVAREIAKMVDPAFANKFGALWEQRDKDGCVKLSKSETEKHLAKAVNKAYALLFGQQTKKLPVPQPKNGNEAKPAEPGFVKLLKRPRPDEIDRRLTDDDMILSGKAILKDKRRVMWDRV